LAQQLREFVIVETGSVAGAATGTATGTAKGTAAWNGMAEVLRSRFHVAADGSRTARRVWLDTFDWRLYHAGCTLEYLSGNGMHEVTLVTHGGERVTAAAPRMSLPCMSGELPAGLLRERVAPIAGIRALLPVATATSMQRSLRLLDGEDKTVVRLTIDRGSLPGPAATALQPRLTVTPVRGYDAQAGQVERLLADLPGLAAAGGSAFQVTLAAIGREAGDYSSHVDVALTSSMPAGAAVAAILLRLLDIAEANVDGVIRDIDTEFLHDLRVTVRRTRAALKLAGDALPGDLAARFAPEFRWLGQLTTPTRDLDVHLLGFAEAAAGLVTAAPADLTPLHDSLVRYRAAEHRRLVRGLRSARFAELTREWRTELRKVARGDIEPGAAQPGKKARGLAADRGGPVRAPIAGLAAARIQRAYRRLARTGAAVTASSPEEDLHMVRKRGKELRYLLEFFAALHDPPTHRSAVRELKQLQDCLGEIQDGHVQREAIRALAVRMVAERAAPAATLLAMGELAAQLDAVASEARDDFGKRFARFTGGRSARLIASLTKVAAA
jgi:CHAD domain-containing protein